MNPGAIKYADGVLALSLGLLWGCRQFALAESYDVLSRYSLTTTRRAAFVLLWLVVLAGIAFTIVCLILTQDDFCAPVTVVVGLLVAWALEARTQSWPDEWLSTVETMRTLTRYRVGWWPPNKSIRYWFKEVKSFETGSVYGGKHGEWETCRTTRDGIYTYYIKPWDDIKRHYNGNTLPCKRAIEYRNRWAAAAACASMTASWMTISKVYYCVDVIIDEMYKTHGRIRASIKSWQKGYMRFMLLEQYDTEREADRISKLAACWLEKPGYMLKVLGKLQDILDEYNSSGAVYGFQPVIDRSRYM